MSSKRQRPRYGSAGAGDPNRKLLAEIKDTIAGQPTYGYRRIHALLRRQRREEGGAVPINVKRVYRVMKAHGHEEVAPRRDRRRETIGRDRAAVGFDGFDQIDDFPSHQRVNGITFRSVK